jgi:hypothetical protein
MGDGDEDGRECGKEEEHIESFSQICQGSNISKSSFYS